MLLEPIRYTWEDTLYRCAAVHHSLAASLRKAGKAVVLVNSGPKTGTTWVLKMIAAVPGYREAGNLHGEVGRYRAARPGDVFHGHDYCKPDLQNLLETAGIRRILTLRDPRDQTVSRMFHLRRDQHHPWHERSVHLDDDEALLACIEGRDDEGLPGVGTMVKLAESWLKRDPAVIVVRYEDLLVSAEREMRRVFTRLAIPVSTMLLRTIVARNRFRRLTVGRRFWRKGRERGVADVRSHYRKGTSGDWVNHLGPRHKERFKELAGETLVAWGYERDLNW